MTLLLILAALQDPDWRKENFAGPVPDRIARSPNGRIELVSILGTRRWRHADAAGSVGFSPDGKRALSAALGSAVIFWDVATGKEVGTWDNRGVSVLCAAFSPDGKRAVWLAGDGAVTVWDVEKGREIGYIVVDGGPASLAIRDGLVLVGNEDTTVMVYRVK
ncbi:MAG: PD40 domain-containing protein [Planctomycetes bacterium]|nr:PD40 domain-containing protein [Planctomycetota bacterium]